MAKTRKLANTGAVESLPLGHHQPSSHRAKQTLPPPSSCSCRQRIVAAIYPLPWYMFNSWGISKESAHFFFCQFRVSVPQQNLLHLNGTHTADSLTFYDRRKYNCTRTTTTMIPRTYILRREERISFETSFFKGPSHSAAAAHTSYLIVRLEFFFVGTSGTT